MLLNSIVMPYYGFEIKYHGKDIIININNGVFGDFSMLFISNILKNNKDKVINLINFVNIKNK